MPEIPNVLAKRYASPEMQAIFSERNRIKSERGLWLALLKAQDALGLAVSADAIAAYESARDHIDLERIQELERQLRHDVKARIEAFNEAAGGLEAIHQGMTSRDLTDNVEQMQVREALQHLLWKGAATVHRLAERAVATSDIVLTARTHRQPAQPTLLGRRLAMHAEELLYHLEGLELLLNRYPLRGIKGPVGTQLDQLSLLGSPEKVEELEQRIASHLGFKRVLNAPGQVYPRSLDFAVLSHVALIGSALENFAKSMRLMGGYELVTEGFAEGQVGSSSMPHKMNTRSSERICGMAELLKMYVDGASRLAGDQWEEGDVSCSVVRRVVLPDAFFCADGMLETALTVLKEMGTYPAVIERELERYLPFLATTDLLMEAIKRGVGREAAHSVLKKHGVQSALALRSGQEQHGFTEALGMDSEFPLSTTEIKELLADKSRFLGNARHQIELVSHQVEAFVKGYVGSQDYSPGDIL